MNPLGLLLPVLASATAFESNMMAEDPRFALPVYIRGELQGYDSYSNGGTAVEGLTDGAQFETAWRRTAAGIEMRAVCAIIVPSDPVADDLREHLQHACAERLLRAIQRLSDSEPRPYRAAGAGALTWVSHLATLATSDVALVVDGSYTDPHSFTPCVGKQHCCSANGALYLDSCREPTEAEWDAINLCQGDGLQLPAPEYLDCLRDHGVHVGCEDQPDGRRLCY